MADNKLSWTELRRALAARANVSEKEANTFLNAFNAQLVEALKQDKQVKINGLGMFKLQAVAPRKSVNVTTGEEIIIEGYNKIAFVPEAGVKELVESGKVKTENGKESDIFSNPIDPIQKLGAQADEIVGILGELGQSPTEVQSDHVQSTKEADKSPETISHAEKTVEPVVEPAVEPEPEPVVEQQPEPAVEPEVEPKKPEEPKKKEKQYHFMRDTLICVVILLMLLLGGYFFLREQIGGWIEEWMQPKPQTEQTEPVATNSIVQEAEPAEQPEEKTVPVEKITYTNLITVERINEGSRLAWLSKRYYGAKVYWPYLYDANKDRLSDPNMIVVGTPIRIPKLTKTQLDTTNTATLATIERLRAEAEAAMK